MMLYTRSFFSKRLITEDFVRIYGSVKISSLRSKFRVCFDDDESEENFSVLFEGLRPDFGFAGDHICTAKKSAVVPSLCTLPKSYGRIKFPTKKVFLR
jgi:hypothetical protein